MKLSEIKHILSSAKDVRFELQNGTFVPDHFHVTEIGKLHKHFIDCSGMVRTEQIASFQLWNTNDLEHRLKPEKLLNIITHSENVLRLEDLEVEVEYQTDTIGKYELGFNSRNFTLIAKRTTCLAMDTCGGSQEKAIVTVSDNSYQQSCCVPGTNC